MEVIIHHVAQHEFPERWESLLTATVVKLKESNSFSEVFGSLLALKNLVENYEYLLEKDREPLEIIVTNIFPLLETFAKNLLDHYNEQEAHALHAILKTFYAGVHLVIPKYLMDEKTLENWMTFFKLVLDKDLGNDLESPTEDPKIIEQRQKNIYWLNKKWAGRILDKFIYKYADRRYERKENTGISQIFNAKYAVPFLESFLRILLNKREKYVHVKVYYHALRYIYRALKIQNLGKLLHEHLEGIMFENMIPAMFLTPKDEEDWQDDPIEFIRKEEDVTDTNNNCKVVAQDLWERFAEENLTAPDGELYIMKFMKYAAQVLTTNTDPRTNQPTDLRVKEAIMHIIGTIRKSIMENETIRDNMEFLLQKYVIPEFTNHAGFLRARACWLFGHFGGLKFSNPDTVKAAVEGIYKCLIDTQLPVKVKAAIALNQLLNQEEALEMLKPGLNQVLEHYLKLINTIDKDELVYALEGIIDRFRDDIHPYAVGLVQHLAEVFFKANKEDGEGGDDDDDDDMEEKQFAAAGCLSAIESIIKAELPRETLTQVEDILVPIFNVCFSEEGCDFMEEALRILGAVVYFSDNISEKMWEYFPLLNYLVAGKPEQLLGVQNVSNLSDEKKLLLEQSSEGWAYEYINEMVPIFENYIQKGRNVIFKVKDPYFNMTYIELLFRTIDRIYEICYNGETDVDMVVVSLLYICIIENYPKEIDEVVTYILEKVSVNLPKAKTNMMRKMHIQIIAQALMYDTKLVLQFLESKQGTEYVFKGWIELLPEFNADFELRRIMFGFASLLRVNLTELPQIVLESLPGLLHEMTKLTKKILEIREDADYEDEEEEEVDEENEEEFKKTIKKLQKFNNKRGGIHDKDFDDDDDDMDPEYDVLEWVAVSQIYDSPLLDVCEILFFKESLELLQSTQPDAYKELVAHLTQEEQEILQKSFQEAQEQDVLFKQKRQEKLEKKAKKGYNA